MIRSSSGVPTPGSERAGRRSGRGTAWIAAALCIGVVVGRALPAHALEGVVVDTASRQPLANAEVTILGRPGVATTDAEGRFSWKPDPLPPFEVLVVTPGGRYLRPVLVERLEEGVPLVIEVEPLLSEEVTVAGAAPGIDATPATATTTLSRRDMEGRQPTTLVQALENVAGVATVSEGHAAVPALRGLARGRTLILVDGARVTSERRVGPSATFLDPLSLEGIEVARGPGSVAYGSDAFGGVILARTRRPDPNSPLRMRVGATLGAGTPERRASVEVSKGTPSGGVLLQARARDYDDYRSPAGTVTNSGARDSGFLGRFEQALGPGRVSLGWQSDFGRDVERPRNNAAQVRFYYPTEDSHRLTAEYELRQRAQFERLTVSGFFGAYRLVTDQDRHVSASAPRTVERADVSANDFQVRGSAERLAGGARVQVGVDVNGRYNLHATDEMLVEQAGASFDRLVNVSIDDARRLNAGAWLLAETGVARALHVAGGLRADRVGSRNRGGYFGDRSTTRSAMSGFASVTAGPFQGVTLTGQLSRGFRDPMLSDRYFRGPSGRGFITGNPDLVPETSVQVDVALRYTSPRVRWAVYAYRYRIADLVERYELEPEFSFFRNRGRARIQGLEAEAELTLTGEVEARVSGQVSRGRAPEDDASLDDVSADTIAVQLRKALGDRAFVQIRGAAHARDDRPGPTERTMPGYAVVDVSGGYRFNARLEASLIVRNLLDQPYLASPDPRAVLAPGLSASLSTVVTF